MAQKTVAETRMTRAELGNYLRTLGDRFEAGEEEIPIEVGNKTVTLSPAGKIDCEVEVVERSSVIRKGRETVDVRLTWKR